MTNLFIVILILFIVFLFVGREVACWYFKINDIKKILEAIEENTRKKNIEEK